MVGLTETDDNINSIFETSEIDIHCESKKLDPFHLSIILANTVRF